MGVTGCLCKALRPHCTKVPLDDDGALVSDHDAVMNLRDVRDPPPPCSFVFLPSGLFSLSELNGFFGSSASTTSNENPRPVKPLSFTVVFQRKLMYRKLWLGRGRVNECLVTEG